MPRFIFLVCLLALCSGCDMASGSNVIAEGDLPPDNTQIGRVAASICERPLYCGAIGYLDCNSAADGPAYFFRHDDGEIISYCGGFCMADVEGRCQRECPPREWVCQDRTPGDIAKHRMRR